MQLADSLLGLRHLGLLHDNDSEKPGQEYRNQFFKQMKTSYRVLIMTKNQLINLKLMDNNVF